MMDGTIATKTKGLQYFLPLELMPNIITNFVNINYYALVSPFRIYYDPVCKKFKAHRHSRIFNAVLITFQCFCSLYFLSVVILRRRFLRPEDYPAENVDELNMFVSEFVAALWLSGNAINKWSMWMYERETIEMLNSLMKTARNFHNATTRISTKTLILVLIGLLLHAPQVFSVLVEIYKFVTCFDIMDTGHKTPNCEAHAGDVLLLIAITHEDLASAFGSSYSLLPSLTMLTLAKRIHSKVSKDSGKKEILENCKSYIRLNLWMRRCSGMLVSAGCFGLLLHNTQKLQKIFVVPTYRVFQLLALGFTHGGCLIFGSMAGSVMNSLSRALMVHRGKANSFHGRSERGSWEEVAILHTVNTDGVGLKTRTFITTYSFLGKILAIVTTYAITLVQMDQQSGG